MARRVDGLSLADLEQRFRRASDFASPYWPRKRAIAHLRDISGLSSGELDQLVSKHRAGCLSRYGKLFREFGLGLECYIRDRREPGFVLPGGGDESDPWDETVADFLNGLGSKAPEFWRKLNRLALEGSRGLRKSGQITAKVAVIGLGLVGSQVAGVLGPLLGDEIVVYSREFCLGGPWFGRDFCVNSSTRANGSRLPLVGDTTMTFPWGEQGLRLWQMSPVKSLRVQCDDGSGRVYPSGLKLGEVIAMNTVVNCRNLLLGQEARVAQQSEIEEGVRVVCTDLLTGDIYVDKYNQVILVTGPGKDIPLGVSDGDKRGRRKLFIRQVENIINGREEILDLPEVITLADIDEAESIWRAWQGADLRLNPWLNWLTKVAGRGLPLAIVGNGDGAKVVFERLKQAAGELVNPPDVVVIGVDLENYENVTRPRYLQTYEGYQGRVAFEPRRAERIINNNGLPVQVKAGSKIYRLAGVVSCVGLARDDYTEAEILRDAKGFPLCRKLSEDVFVVGSAAGFGLSDYPKKFAEPFELLGIEENSVSLALNGTGSDRFTCWFITNKVNRLRRRPAGEVFRPVSAALLGLI